ncbi:MAG TPA: hypothetical protein VNJ01_17260 [Bacteriovoracaceae bacterium]|nr:hypothetical protein [Bacteriovoracaceae bacterium]
MDIFKNHLTDWLILFGIIASALYTLRIIGEEKSSFKDEATVLEFSNLKLQIPNWWSITEQTDHRLRFARTDTRYDWYALFQFYPGASLKTLPKILEELLNDQNIEFDLDVVFETDSRVLFRDSIIQEHFQEVIRVEGKASENIVDRIYYDLFLMRNKDDEGYFVFESKSSVLNGLVEGPYFEESLAELSFIHETQLPSS